MSQFLFGSGTIWATPLIDAAGNAVATPTPVKFLACQDISSDMSFDAKLLHGSSQFPLAVARGKGKASVKVKSGQVNGAIFNNAFFGQTAATGQSKYVNDITGTVVPTTPFAITPTPPSSGTWTADLGVRNASGVPMTRVTSLTAVNQYTVSAGLYTFYSGEVGNRVYIDYRYTVTTGQTISVANQLLGSTPTVALDIVVPYAGNQLTFRFPQAVSSKLTMATKLDDFTLPEMDFDCFADAAGNIGTFGFSE